MRPRTLGLCVVGLGLVCGCADKMEPARDGQVELPQLDASRRDATTTWDASTSDVLDLDAVGADEDAALPPPGCTTRRNALTATCVDASCEPVVDVSLFCNEELLGIAFAVGPARAHLALSGRGAPRIFHIGTDEIIEDNAVPFVYGAPRMAVDQRGTLWAYGVVRTPSEDQLWRLDTGAWSATDAIDLHNTLMLEIDQMGVPIIAGTLRDPSTQEIRSAWAHAGSPPTFAPPLIELTDFTLAADGTLSKFPREASVNLGEAEVPLTNAPTGWRMLARLPAIESGADITMPLAAVVNRHVALALMWITQEGVTWTDIAGTQNTLTSCGATGCQGSCEYKGIEADRPVVTRDRNGHVYVAFRLMHYDETHELRQGVENWICERHIVRANNSHELVVLRFDDGSLTPREMLRLPGLGSSGTPYGISTWGDEVGLMVHVGGSWNLGETAEHRVLRFRVANTVR